MALLSKTQTRRVDIPHEPGEWVEVRPLTVADLDAYRAAVVDVEGVTGRNVRLLDLALVAWSYPEEKSLETLLTLDITTYNWLMDTINDAAGVRDDAEKKDSSSASTVGPAPETLLSRVS